MAPFRSVVSCTLLSALGLLSACGNVEHQLLPERDIPELNVLGVASEKHSRGTVMVRSDATADAPLMVAVHEYVREDGAEQTDRVIVTIHGVLSDHRAWRYVIGALDGNPEVWAIDLPGCGMSDSPEPDDLSEEAYSPTWLARHVLSALGKQLARRESDVRLTLVCHSLGGGVALRMLGDLEIRSEFPDVLDRIDGAVLIAPLDFGFGKTDAAFEQLARLSDLLAAAGTVGGFVRKAAAKAVYWGCKEPGRIPSEEFARLYEILTDPVRRHAMQCMLRRAVPRKKNDDIDWDKALLLMDDYRNVEVPCLILWGERDETLPSNSGYRFERELPAARLKLFRECMHSVQVEEPRRCVELIRRFIDEDKTSWKKDEDEEAPELLDRSPRMRVAGSGEGGATKQGLKETTSSLREKPAASAPSTVSVLTGRDVQRSGVRYLSDALRMVPGAEVQRISSTESAVAFRGFVDTSSAAQGTLCLVDGRQAYNQFLGSVLWDQLAVRIEDVKHIEIIRGPGSFIHGPNAMHGVVNIRTKSPLDYAEDSVSVIAHAGSYDSVVVGTTLVNRTQNTGFKISAQWDDIGQFGSEREDTRDKGFVEASFEVKLEGDSDHVLGLAAGFSQQRFDILMPGVEVIPSTTMDNAARELFAKANYRVGDPDDLAVRAQFTWTGFDAETVPEQFYERFSLDLETLDVDAQVVWATGAHFLTGGAGYRNTTFDTSGKDVTDGRHSVNQGWFFAQDEFAVTDALSFTFGARLDLHSETGSAISPRAAAVWEFVGDHFFRATAGRGFRNPSLRELWFDMQVEDVPGVPVAITISGNDDLDAESLTSFELGYFGSWGAVLDVEPGTLIAVDPKSEPHEFEAGVTAFYNVIDDLISFQSDPADPLVVLPVNQKDEEVFGFELEGRYVFSDSFSALANYSYAVARDRETGERNRQAPLQTVNAGVAYSGHGFNTMLWANYHDDSELNGVAIDSYILVSGSISYGFPVALRTDGQVFIRFFNLLDDDHREHPQGDAYGLILTGGLQLDW